MQRARYLLIAGAAAFGLVFAGTAAGFWPGQKQVEFNREVRPLQGVSIVGGSTGGGSTGQHR